MWIPAKLLARQCGNLGCSLPPKSKEKQKSEHCYSYNQNTISLDETTSENMGARAFQWKRMRERYLASLASNADTMEAKKRERQLRM